MSEEIRPGYTRVTDILGQWNKDLVDDSGNVVAKVFSGSRTPIDINVLNNKANIGTNVHKAIEGHLEGLDMPLVGREAKYFESFKKWNAEVQCEFVENERRYYCDELMITGCIDALIRFSGSDELILMDFKTSASENPKIWPLQATMYHYLVTKSGRSISDRLLFLKLDGKGAKATVFEYTFTPQLLKVCKAAIFCHRYLNS